MNCQNEILIVSESVKDEPLSCGDKEADGCSDILWRGLSFPLCCECCITQNQITLILLLTSWKTPCSPVHAQYTNLLHDELNDRWTKRGASGPLRAFPSTDLQFQLTQLSSPLFVARDRCLRGLDTHMENFASSL